MDVGSLEEAIFHVRRMRDTGAVSVKSYQLPRRDWLVEQFSRPELSRVERLRLLAGTPGSAQEDAGKTVCACFGVGENTLIRGIRVRGLSSPEGIGEALRAGTNCGSCLSEIRSLIAQHAPR